MEEVLHILSQNWLIVTILAIISYLIGSINPAILFTKMVLHKDIRTMGSKNAGFTNVLRCVGKGPAIMTIIFDFFKGIFAAFMGSMIMSTFATDILGYEFVKFGALICGFCAILGHIFPVFFGFKGGKGVTTAIAVILVTDVKVFTCVILAFLACFMFTKIVSLSSIVGAVAYPVCTFVLLKYITDVVMPTHYIAISTAFAILIAVTIIIKHKSNIVRILNGTEKKIEPKQKEPKQAKKGKRLTDKDINK